MRMLRDHGQAQKYYHDIEGYNGRLDAIQAGILRVKLKHLPEWTEQRRAAAARYRELFADCGALAHRCPIEPAWSKAGLSPVRGARSEPGRVHEATWRRRASAPASTIPIPLHLQKAYEVLGYKKGDFPVTENGRGGDRLAADVPAVERGPAT